MTKILVALFLISNIFKGSAYIENNRCFLSHTFHIYVINELPPNSSLLVHCASGNDDLGYHTLSPTQVFTWKFCENIFKTTLFFCHLWWGDKQNSFDAFESNYHWFRYHKFSWYARADGIYSDTDYSDDVIKRYDWANK
ncbi:hypothetical protein F511_18529 [Dorcoceras hygrometricum]|uniref:S-protein homolog n=1 Tax=Dorcoceras hygrometricum TaxID=472368 RepID=A0A2Z7B4Y1_9LAMI|nr:hypothetical protein F511_18529 [Dorcoceras hygrometricum]